ncbi:MAG: acetylglutamate kinase, partial [Bryobacteraceae bacterium]|nr:acetylglutamate kinase [Bryobacteraceae bacterium]
GGGVFNVNADQMAVACAVAFQAERLIFLTDVEGVKGSAGDVISSLRLSDCTHLIRSGVATGGMEAKLNAATDAICGGTREVVIAPGAMERGVARILAGERIGTRIVLEEATHA